MKHKSWLLLVIFFVVAIALLSGCYVACDLKNFRLVNLGSKNYDRVVMNTIIKSYGPNTFSVQNTNNNQVSSETSKIFQLGREIQTIERETQYIQDYGELPPKTPDFYRRLNIV